MFYVYEYYIVETNHIFYVGKGTKRRMYELHNRNKYFKSIYNKHVCNVRIVKNSLSNEEAIALEIARIAELKSVNQANANFTNGGDGFSTGSLNPTHKVSHKGELNQFYGKQHSVETKQKISENRKGKGARFGESNPMFGKAGLKGAANPMFGKKGLNHPNATVYQVEYVDGSTEQLNYKKCELKFGIAFTRINKTGGTLHYNKACNRDIWENTKITLSSIV